MRTFLVALLALALAPSLAEARNAKGVTFITVFNDGSDFLAVIDRDFTFPEGNNPSINAAAFFRAGGRLVPPGSFFPFVIKNGSSGNGTITRTITAAFVTHSGARFSIGSSDSTVVTVEKGGTAEVIAEEDSSGGVILSQEQ
jgi:hypothetical protein